MDPKNVTIAGLLALLGTGVVYEVVGGKSTQLALAPDATGKTELAGAEATAVLLDDAGQPRVFEDGAKVACKPGGYLDGVWRDDVEWCSDGKGQTWTRDAKGAETMTVSAGKIYVEAKGEAKTVEAEAVK